MFIDGTIIMERKESNIMKNISFHDQEILDLKINNNNLTLITNDDLGKQYTFSIKNARIESNSIVNINEIKGSIIITLSYHQFESEENYIHLEIANKNSPFNDEFYIYSNDINISKN